jgi:hypothetical protein
MRLLLTVRTCDLARVGVVVVVGGWYWGCRYGGFDSVLLWHSYPNIGVDDRNQFQMLLSLPGGAPALRQAVADFHALGVRVLVPYNPWDQGTAPSNASGR